MVRVGLRKQGQARGPLYLPISLYQQLKFWQLLYGRIRVSEALMDKKPKCSSTLTVQQQSQLTLARSSFIRLIRYFETAFRFSTNCYNYSKTEGRWPTFLGSCRNNDSNLETLTRIYQGFSQVYTIYTIQLFFERKRAPEPAAFTVEDFPVMTDGKERKWFQTQSLIQSHRRSEEVCFEDHINCQKVTATDAVGFSSERREKAV